MIDTETTGVYNSDRVVEIALVTLSLDGQVIDEWESMVQPESIRRALVAKRPSLRRIDAMSTS